MMNEDRIYYTVIDRTDGDCTEYGFDSIKGATRWIEELIDIFKCRAEDVTAYARQYTKHGTFIGQERFF